jgi:hypothetical protein
VRGLAIAAAVPAVVFTLLFIGIARMATYFFPLVTIALVLLFGQRSRLVPIAIIAGTLIGIPLSMNPTLMRILGGGRISEADWEAFGRQVPRDAKVAAPWGDAEIYALWAPQGRYLNVLDPIFMARPHPRQYAIQRAIFDGSHPDIPGAAKRDLDSDFVALDWTNAPPILIERIKSDPRLHVRYGGYNVLLEIVPSGLKFISAPPAGCTTFDRIEQGPQRFAFAPYGAGAVAIDGKVVASSSGTYAILSRAVNVDVPAGSHLLAIRTCGARGFNGYYLVPIFRGPSSALRAPSPRKRGEGQLLSLSKPLCCPSPHVSGGEGQPLLLSKPFCCCPSPRVSGERVAEGRVRGCHQGSVGRRIDRSQLRLQ